MGSRRFRCRLAGWKRTNVHLWARGFWVVSSGNVTDEMWVDYNQEPDATGTGRQLQRHLSWRHVHRRWTNPALSRNLKPPPLGGGVFTFFRWPDEHRRPLVPTASLIASPSSGDNA